jgi:divalent metal cation (Fe/Co/Zn/Cd) transporter
VGIFLGKIYWWVDGVLGLLVSLMILYEAYHILKESANTLLGEKPSKKLTTRLHTISKEAAGYNVRVHHVHIHRYGEHTEITFHIALPDDIKLKKAHQIIEIIEQKVDQELEMTATIHPDPLDGEMD